MSSTAPRIDRSLTFNKSCRFTHVKLNKRDIMTRGYLWKLGRIVQTADFPMRSSQLSTFPPAASGDGHKRANVPQGIPASKGFFCIQGKHRLAAASRELGERYFWTVLLYYPTGRYEADFRIHGLTCCRQRHWRRHEVSICPM
jgi:hypothetical protein